jgi:hypothetical protein
VLKQEEHMGCTCGSENLRSFPGDVKIYFDAGRTAAPSVFRLDVAMCLDCGLSQFTIPDGWNELHAFRRAAGE